MHGPGFGNVVRAAAGLEKSVVCLFCHVLLDSLFGCKSAVISIKIYILNVKKSKELTEMHEAEMDGIPMRCATRFCNEEKIRR